MVSRARVVNRGEVPSIHGKLGIVLVTYGNESSLLELLHRIGLEKKHGDFVVLIDNHAQHGCAKIAEKSKIVDLVLRSKNIGFAAGCNVATRSLPDDIDLILLLNPDVMPTTKAITRLRSGADEDWVAWMGLLKLPGGAINSAGNILHMSGLSWCGDYGQSIDVAKTRHEVVLLSGACLMIRQKTWHKIGGFAEEYFMYYEDTDLSMTIHQMGLKIGIVPEAQFEHDYIFNKSQSKWFYLERNRYIFICRQWPLSIILLLAPYLIISEIGLWGVSLWQGRFFLRIAAVKSFILVLPKILKDRRVMKKKRVTNNLEFFSYLQPRFTTSLLGKIGDAKLINNVALLYYQVIRALLLVAHGA